jgi:hypothetical protein
MVKHDECEVSRNIASLPPNNLYSLILGIAFDERVNPENIIEPTRAKCSKPGGPNAASDIQNRFR